MRSTTLTFLADRTNRVRFAVSTAAVFGLLDLFLTYREIATRGMCEANPIARAVMDAGPVSLVAFKLASIGVCSALLLVAARRLAGEVGAWTALVIMASVMVVWAQYLPLAEVDGMELVCDASFRRW